MITTLNPARGRLDSSWTRAARLALFGLDWQGAGVVLTPIRALFSRLAAGGTAYDGWWSTVTVEDHLIVHVPQGSPAVDAIYALPPGMPVTFLGLAGGLRHQLVGTMIEPASAAITPTRFLDLGDDTTAVDLIPRTFRVSQAAAAAAAAVVATVECLAASSMWHHKLARVADCVDMETGHLFAAASGGGQLVRSLLIISDHNDGGAVFGSRIEDLSPRFDEICDAIRAEFSRQRPADDIEGGTQ